MQSLQNILTNFICIKRDVHPFFKNCIQNCVLVKEVILLGQVVGTAGKISFNVTKDFVLMELFHDS